MKDTSIKVKIRRCSTESDSYIIESIDGLASLRLNYPPKCSSRNHMYRAGNTITQEEADAIALEYQLQTLAPK